ncbi:phthiocerol/phthiodiolone dimycocerosyl transferase family protein [Nocardia sp. NBC_01327]|uniref:phthiocerol/phthiodiolone dimycocerosyl transferase family protein n=1 Tax=Nocardia sp. NBC_01327 TaxID=2903593 RepID=UPI002E0F2D4B|nr:hypothetical protein OG326_41145 [Nocardia sp. NBC_01327]
MVASTSATTATDFGRPLSPSERWFWIIDRISPSNCTARVRVHGRLTVEQLECAAAALTAEYPLLRAGVVDAGAGDPHLMPLPDPRIPVRQLLSDDPKTWRREIDAELIDPFDTRAGLARIADIVQRPGTVAEQHDLILTVSHIILDGRSLMTVLRKLIQYAASERSDNRAGIRSRAAFPPADDLIPAGARGVWRYVYSTLFDQAAALVLRPRRVGGGTPVGLLERRTRVVYRTVAAEPLAALVADCRWAGVTVHGVLAAAVARAIGDSVRPKGSGVAGIGSPVDFRPLLRPRPDAEELGVYAPVLAGFVRFGPGESLWAAARSVNRQVERGIRQRRHLSTVAGMRFGTPRTVESGRRIVDMVDRRAPWNVSVTNLGRIDFPEEVGAWQLSGLTLTASNSCVSAVTVAIVTAHGEMRIGFCYVDGMLTEPEKFADQVLAELISRPDPESRIS